MSYRDALVIRVGRVAAIVRYPVKSMAGVSAGEAFLGWHGLAGDRRFAFRRVGDASGMPWLTASRMHDLVRYVPVDFDEKSGEPLPSRVRTPSGASVALAGAALAAEIGGRFAGGVELMRLRHGIFDETPVSVIALPTIAGIGREAGLELDPRRFRANFLLETERAEPFHEDAWVGGTLRFGDGDASPSVRVTMRDERCVMVNLDPETAEADARVMKAVVRLNGNTAGVYATVQRTGPIRVGDPVTFVGEEA